MIAALSYIIVESRDVDAWQRFGGDVLGMMPVRLSGGLALKMDERAGRVFVEPGATDRFAASGWEVLDEAAFDTAIARVKAAGAEVYDSTAAEKAFRHVRNMAWFRDPSGNRHEICQGYVSDFAPFVSPVAVPRFITGDLGLGHMVLPAPEYDATLAFMTDVMGFGVADHMVHHPRGAENDPHLRIGFLHCDNGRHHSLALFEGAVPSGCIHLMFEVPGMDELGRAYDRMLAHGVRLMATLGRHVNDHMISFYMMSPGGFAIEYGCGGRVVDWGRHAVFESTAVSMWGHDFSVGFGADEQAAIAAAA